VLCDRNHILNYAWIWDPLITDKTSQTLHGEHIVHSESRQRNAHPIYCGHRFEARGYALSPITFNQTLEKVVRNLQCLRNSQVINIENDLRILGFSDHLDIIRNSLTEVVNTSREETAKKSV